MCTNKRHLFKESPINRFGFGTSLIFIIVFVLFHFQAFAQVKQANIWYFGNKAGIDFNSGSPPVTLLNSQMSAGGGG